MTKFEFENEYGKPISNEHYKLIEFVYMYHPCIDSGIGKSQVATLYKMCGLQVFRDMEQTAKEAQTLEEDILKLRAQIESKRTKLEALKKGEIYQ